MTDWATRSQSFLGDDKSWLASAFGVDMGLPIELDLALFDLTTNFPNGFLPSGIVLGEKTSTSQKGHYDPGTTEVQSLVATGGTVGDFTLTAFGETTAAIAWNATAADVQAALLLLGAFNPGDVVCTGGPLPTTPVVITFGGQYVGQNVPALVVVDNITNGTATITTSTGGGTGAATGGAGLEVAHGLLLFPVDTMDNFGNRRTTGPATAAMMTIGRVYESRLPAHHGLDAAAKLALPRIEFLP